jgi:PAS domain S-box-containing protein
MIITPQEILAARILLVDDQASNIALLTQLLEGAGYSHVTSTMEPKNVGPLHRLNRYDLILLDLQMPEMDGFQVMEVLKTSGTDSYLPVIVLTAQPAHKLRALQAGAKDFISKPIDLVEVKTRVYNMLEVRMLYRRLESANAVLEETVRVRTAELRESEACYRSLTELSTDWYWEQDEKGRFTKVSGPVLQMLGFKGESLEDSGSASDYMMEGWNEDERLLLQEKITAHEPFLDFPVMRTNGDGSSQRFHVSGEPMFNRSCQLIGYRGIGLEVKPGI